MLKIEEKRKKCKNYFIKQKGQIPLYIYPFISTRQYKSIYFEKIRLSGLGVIGSLLQVFLPFLIV